MTRKRRTDEAAASSARPDSNHRASGSRGGARQKIYALPRRLRLGEGKTRTKRTGVRTDVQDRCAPIRGATLCTCAQMCRYGSRSAPIRSSRSLPEALVISLRPNHLPTSRALSIGNESGENAALGNRINWAQSSEHSRSYSRALVGQLPSKCSCLRRRPISRWFGPQLVLSRPKRGRLAGSRPEC